MPSGLPPHILLVEDDPSDLELTLRALKKTNIANRIEVRSSRCPGWCCSI